MQTSQLPPSIDLRNTGGFPAVYDQCGLNSCTAAAAAALAQYEMHFQNGDAGVFEPSRMFLYYEERRSGRTGFRDSPIRMEECIRAIVRSGICAEELWPYIPERAGDPPPPTAYDSAFRPRIARRLTQNLDDLRGCLVEGHPFVCGVALYPSVHGVATRTIGAIAMPVAGERVRSGHAILIVGYDDANERFILRNSLGPDWGNRGHGTIPYRYMLDAALAYDFWTLREFVPVQVSSSIVPTVVFAESRAFDVATPPLGAPDPDGDLLDPQWPITFAATSLAEGISQPIIVDQLSLAIFGSASGVFLAQVAKGDLEPFPLLPSIPATTLIHGWAYAAGYLYVQDGPILSRWDITNTGMVVARQELATFSDADQAQVSVLRAARQQNEWATLLEQVERECSRQAESGAINGDLQEMRIALRTVVGCADPNSDESARQRIASIRDALAKQVESAHNLCFSPPVVRKHKFSKGQNSVFVLQGNGTLHVCDLPLSGTVPYPLAEAAGAELHLAVAEDKVPQPSVFFVANGALHAVHADTGAALATWEPPAEASATSVGPEPLRAVGDTIWWVTSGGIYGLEPSAAGALNLTYQSGRPGWGLKQIGTLGTAQGSVGIADPNDLFEAMNIKAWINARTNPTAPLTDGMLAQLLASDADGRYQRPAIGTSNLLYAPFSELRTGASWTGCRIHEDLDHLLVMNDDAQVTSLCGKPSLEFLPMLPIWAVADWQSSPAMLEALSALWPAPAALEFTEDFTAPAGESGSDIGGRLRDFFRVAIVNSRWSGDSSSRLHDLFTTYDDPNQGRYYGPEAARTVREILRRIVFGQTGFTSLNSDDTEEYQAQDWTGLLAFFFNSFYQADFLNVLRQRYGEVGKTWTLSSINYWSDLRGSANAAGWNWINPPGTPLFITPPPAWYDPWGLNRPADFASSTGSPFFLDPFAFSPPLQFPQRSIPMAQAASEDSYRYVSFVGGDPNVILAPDVTISVPPHVLIVAVDERAQRSRLLLVPCAPAHPTYTSQSQTISRVEQAAGYAAKLVVSPASVYIDPQSTTGSLCACCVVHTYSPGARIQQLSTRVNGQSPWTNFVAANAAKYAPNGGAWAIDQAPLPPEALPQLELQGYSLPLATKE